MEQDAIASRGVENPAPRTAHRERSACGERVRHENIRSVATVPGARRMATGISSRRIDETPVAVIDFERAITA